MKKSIPYMVKGAILGLISGFVASEIFTFSVAFGGMIIFEGDLLSFLFVFLFGQMIAVFPGVVTSTVFSVLLSVVMLNFIKKQRVGVIVGISSFLHLVGVSVVYLYNLSAISHSSQNMLGLYERYWPLVWLIYIPATAWFALNFYRRPKIVPKFIWRWMDKHELDVSEGV